MNGGDLDRAIRRPRRERTLLLAAILVLLATSVFLVWLAGQVLQHG